MKKALVSLCLFVISLCLMPKMVVAQELPDAYRTGYVADGFEEIISLTSEDIEKDINYTITNLTKKNQLLTYFESMSNHGCFEIKF